VTGEDLTKNSSLYIAPAAVSHLPPSVAGEKSACCLRAGRPVEWLIREHAWHPKARM